MTRPPCTTRSRLAWLLGYIVTTFLSFPHMVGDRVVDLGGWVAWLGPACLLMGLRGLSPWRSLGHTFLAVWLSHSLILHWFYVVTVTYGHAPSPVGVVAPIGAALYPAAITCGFGFGWARLQARGSASPFVAAGLWVALEHLRGFLFSGFPWASLGYSQHANGALLGIASLTGVYGLSFAVFLAGAALALLVQAWREAARPPRQALAALAVVLALHVLGPLLRPVDGDQTVRVAALQGNIDQGVKWSPSWFERTLRIYEDLSREAALEGARLIVWPESAVPGVIEADSRLRERLSRLARETQAVLVVGGVGTLMPKGGQGGDRRYFDSAYLIQSDGQFADRYDKSHLVPFGEYVPLRALLGEFIGGVATGVSSSDVTQGSGPRALSVQLPLGETAGKTPAPSAGSAGSADSAGLQWVKLGTPICYELIFPDLVRRFVGEGAQLLLGITNDAWYGRTGAPYQFLAMTAMRSAETGTWTVRAANTGVSAIIDSAGRVREALPIFERGKLVAEVPIRGVGSRPTLYVRVGDAFALACWATALLAIGITEYKGRKGRRANEQG